jgi:predicted nucleic acid-binding protein
LGLLHRLFEKVWIPAVVQQELTGSRRFPAVAQTFNHAWLQLSPACPFDAFLAAELDPGEAAMISLAQQLKNAVVLIDERKGRRVAERVYGLRILGTGGLLLRAKTVGLIAGVQSCLSAMKANGYYLGDRLVRAVCQAAGESMSL